MISFLSAVLILGATIHVEVTKNSGPIAKQRLQFIGFKEGEPTANQDAITDSRGRAQFKYDLKEDETYLVRTIYQDLQYVSDLILRGQAPKKALSLVVYDTKEDLSYLSLKERNFFWSLNGGTLTIEEDLVLENKSPFAIVGKKDAEKPETWRIHLPSNAFDLKFESGFSREETQFEGNDILIGRPALPGTSQFSYSYSIDLQKSSTVIETGASVLTQQLYLATSIDGLEFDLPGLQAGPQKFYNGKMARTFFHPGPFSEKMVIGAKRIPFPIRLRLYIPWIVLGLLLSLAFWISRGTAEIVSASNEEDLLKQLSNLEILKRQNLIQDQDGIARRLQILKQLYRLKNKKGF